MHEASIDIVYTWVNGAEPAYQQLLAKHGQTATDLNPERYRDMNEMLRYSMRSVMNFAPWVRKIYLFTCRPQVPDWLNCSYPKLTVVHHDEIIDADYLPTFSSSTIESHLHKLPGLSDFFIYMNDDMFLGRPITPQNFIPDQNTLCLYGVRKRSIFNTRLFLQERFFYGWRHTPSIIYKPYWSEMIELWKNKFDAIWRRPFRSKYNLSPELVYRYQCQRNNAFKVIIPAKSETKKSLIFNKITNKYDQQKKVFDMISIKRPLFFCLNDDQGFDPSPMVRNLTDNFLQSYFPKPSILERNTDAN